MKMDAAGIHTSLLSAIQKENLGTLQQLLNKHSSDVSNVKRNALLHIAVESGTSENVVDLLLRNKANVNAKDENDKTALFVAVEKGHLQIVEKLIKHGACVNSACSSEPLAPIAPIHVAARDGNKGIVKLLLRNNVNIEAKDIIGYTALHIAAQSGWVEIGKRLLSSGASVDSNTVSNMTPLHVAIQCNHPDFVKLLLEHNADVNFPDICGGTPLHTAAEFGYEEMVNILLECNVDINARSRNGKTPLHVAARFYKRDVGEILLAHGADPNAVQSNGMMPLHHVCMRPEGNAVVLSGQKDLVELLLSHGADPNVKCKNDITPLHFAVEVCNRRAIKLLLDYNADLVLLNKWKEMLNSDNLYKTKIIFYEHMIKMRAANLHVIEEHLQSFGDVEQFENRCEEEIGLMKSVKIVNGTVSLHDLLISNVNQIARYVCSEDVEIVIKHVDNESEFPIYAKMLRSKLSNGVQRKKLLEQFHSSCNNFLALPEYCIDRITSYISNYDLQNLMEACKLHNASNDEISDIKHTNFGDVNDHHISKKKKINFA